MKSNEKKFQNVQEAYGWFFLGEVRLIKQGFLTAKYSLVENGAIVKVKNSAHVRMIFDQFNLPDKFKIIAPTEAVTEIRGKVPDSYMSHLRAIEYIKYQNVYQF